MDKQHAPGDGPCSGDDYTYVDGTVSSATEDPSPHILSYNFTPYNTDGVGIGTGTIGNLPEICYFGGLCGASNQTGAAQIGSSQTVINGFIAADAAFAVGYVATYVPAAIGALTAAQATAAAEAAAELKAAQEALKRLPPEQYRLLQGWLGPIKAGSPITSPPPSLSADAMRRYLAVAEAYIATGGSGAAFRKLGFGPYRPL